MDSRRRRLEEAAHAKDQATQAPLTPGEHHTMLFAYEMLVLRAQTQTNLVWQTPSLGLTAQAFLLTIALEADYADLRRGLAALLGLVVAVISMQTMAKHRYFENLDNFKMEKLERQLSLPPIAKRGWDKEAPLPDGFRPPKKKWPIQMSSYRVWQVGLAVFAFVDVLIIIVYLTGSSLLAHNP
jgi:hypothetical protein